MDKAYVLVAYGGSYDSTWQVNVGVFLDKTMAESAVFAANEVFTKYRDLCQKGDGYIIKWHEENPRPPIGNYFRPSEQHQEWLSRLHREIALYRLSIGLRSEAYSKSADVFFNLTDDQMSEFTHIRMQPVQLNPTF